jgi:hypothetical protein
MSRKKYQLPQAATAKALMLKIAGSPKRVHEYGSVWIESRWCRRGWWAVLWPLPRQKYILDYKPVVQDPGVTLPVYCRTREEAVDWAKTLAEQWDYPENEKRRIVWPKRASA